MYYEKNSYTEREPSLRKKSTYNFLIIKTSAAQTLKEQFHLCHPSNFWRHPIPHKGVLHQGGSFPPLTVVWVFGWCVCIGSHKNFNMVQYSVYLYFCYFLREKFIYLDEKNKEYLGCWYLWVSTKGTVGPWWRDALDWKPFYCLSAICMYLLLYSLYHHLFIHTNNLGLK